MAALRLGSTLLLLLVATACGGGTSGQAQSPTSAAQQRLQGSWQLLQFQPSLLLEAPLQGLLDAQLRALTITFDAGSFTATGPGVDTGGRYEITTASGDSLGGRLYDRAGAGYGVTGQFVGTQFRFTSTDSPWTGSGILERAR
ncbi:MAG: hypothetical protein EOO73_07435 [Myxococcales bacterium]|nr:MAG: hypothetical protein EOO73_07435 [Myxococcales bacterium]